jgi:hypothetical protein
MSKKIVMGHETAKRFEEQDNKRCKKADNVIVNCPLILRNWASAFDFIFCIPFNR